METSDVSETISALWEDVLNDTVSGYIPPQSLIEQWDVQGLTQALSTDFGLDVPVQTMLDADESLIEEDLRRIIVEQAQARYAEKEALLGQELRLFEKRIMLDILDNLWKEHLAGMDYLRQGIHLRAYAQKQPKQEYKREAFELFEGLLYNEN